MKIAMLTPYAGIVNRGAENVTKELKNQLGKNHTLDVYSWKETDWTISVGNLRPKENFRRIHKKIFKYLPTPPFLGPLWIDDMFFGLNFYKKMIEEGERYDFIIVNCGFWGGIASQFYKRVFDAPFLIIGHGGGHSEIFSLLSKPDGLVPLNIPTKKALDVFGITKIKFIPNGVDLETFNPKGPKYPDNYFKKIDKNVKIQRPKVLCACAFEKFKRVDLVIKAVSKLDKGTLILAGDGPLRDKLISMGRELLGNRFLYLGFFPHKDIPKLYRSCDVYCLPSIGENASVALLEALACNTPVVTHADWNRRYVIGKGGELVDVRDIEKFANVLKNIRKMDFRGLPRKQAEKFSWEKIAKSYEKFMKEIISE
jgi:glycosyltransferase involved in cell wall biosynthesis